MKQNKDWQITATHLITFLAICAALVVIIAQSTFYWQISFPLAAGDKKDAFNNPMPVYHDAGEMFGTVRLEPAGKTSLPKAKILVNGIEMGDFALGEVLIRVYENDIVKINVTAYGRDLTFYITRCSANLKLNSKTAIYSSGGWATLDKIAFK